jgi:hypothetical protein
VKRNFRSFKERTGKDPATVSNAQYFAQRQRVAPPWFVIAREAARGVPLESISRRYRISVDTLQKRLQLALCANPDEGTLDSAVVTTGGERLSVRNEVEIRKLSEKVRSDLATVMSRLSTQCLADAEALEEINIKEFQALVDTGSKLFGWHTQKEPFTPVPQPTHAVNVALIQTSPEQLKAMGQSEDYGTITGSTP